MTRATLETINKCFVFALCFPLKYGIESTFMRGSNNPQHTQRQQRKLKNAAGRLDENWL